MSDGIDREIEIGGEVGYIVRKHHLSDAAAADIHKMFCQQAIRWESKIEFAAKRICNQRKEIAKLLAAAAKPPIVPPQQCEHINLAGGPATNRTENGKPLPDLPAGMDWCLDCGKDVPSEDSQ